jgi:hypothetical protein
VQAEATKSGIEPGHYLNPELYGAPEEAGMDWARHPEMMKKMKEARQRQLHRMQTSK